MQHTCKLLTSWTFQPAAAKVESSGRDGSWPAHVRRFPLAVDQAVRRAEQ